MVIEEATDDDRLISQVHDRWHERGQVADHNVGDDDVESVTKIFDRVSQKCHVAGDTIGFDVRRSDLDDVVVQVDPNDGPGPESGGGDRQNARATAHIKQVRTGYNK